ncbi:MAG: hypothetical protein WBF25_00505, partial [Terriglobales bacterium]
PLVVSMPTGQGVSVTVACVPPVSEPDTVCVQFSAVVAYVIPATPPGDDWLAGPTLSSTLALPFNLASVFGADT